MRSNVPLTLGLFFFSCRMQLSLLFGFPEDTRYDDPKLSENARFMTKGSRLIKAIDMAASFLGPDLEPFETQLYELGWRHIAMQAQPEHWPFVGEALLCVFEDCMIGGITKEERESWIIVSIIAVIVISFVDDRDLV